MSALVVTGGTVAWAVQREAAADALVAGARARLDAPFIEAPTLDRLQASTAKSMLERARDQHGRDDAETRGLLDYAEALEDLQRGDLVLAEAELGSALTYLGETIELHVLAAALSHGRLLDDVARRELDVVLRAEPDHPRARLLAADLALDAGDPVGAREHLEALVEAEPRSAAAWNHLGLAREALGEDALEAFQRAAALDPAGPDALINVGRMARVAHDHQGALESFEEAVRRAPNNSSAVLGRGLARAATGSLDAAAEDFQRAAELAPNDAEPLLALGDLLRDLGRTEDAITIYRRAIDREDADAASWLKLGNALAITEQWAEGANAFRAAIARAPELGPAHNGLGACLMHVGDEAASDALERAAALTPGDATPLMNLALIAERGGRLADARAAWTRVLEREPGSTIAERRLARL